MSDEKSYHINHFDKCEPHWPNGAWSVYRITGDEIASRIVRDEGKVIARHSWCGYLGMWEKIEDAMAAIQKDMKKN